MVRAVISPQKIDIKTCSECGGDVRIIACIEDLLVISTILTYLDDKAVTVGTAPVTPMPGSADNGVI